MHNLPLNRPLGDQPLESSRTDLLRASPPMFRWPWLDRLSRVHPVVPPKVEYNLTRLGLSLGAAFCGVWIWAAENLKQVEKARHEFDKKSAMG